MGNADTGFNCAVRRSFGSNEDNLLTINGISYIQVQPVFLYESLWCLLLFLLLMAMRRKKKYEGELFMIYLAGYGLGRFFFEWIRTDKLYIPGTKWEFLW